MPITVHLSGHNTERDGRTDGIPVAITALCLRAMRTRCKNELCGHPPSEILLVVDKLKLTRHHHFNFQRNWAMRRWIIVISKFSPALSDAVTLTFGPLSLNVCSTSGVMCSNCRLQTLSEIEHFAAELFTINRIFAVQFLMGAQIPEQLSRVRGPNFIKL